MITKRHLIIVALLTFCVTATLFMIQPTRSQSGVGEYNPWADYNEDGLIDIFDLVPGAASFGTEGDPTKNVNVTNWPSSFGGQNSEVIVLCQNYTFSTTTQGLNDFIVPYSANVQNYKYINVYLAYINYGPDPSPPQTGFVEIFGYASCANMTGEVYSDMLLYHQISGSVWQFKVSADCLITGPEVQFQIENHFGQTVEFTVMLYCHN